MKVKKVINQRVFHRFKFMTSAFMLLCCLAYFSNSFLMNMDLDNAAEDLSGFYVNALEDVPKTLQYANGYIEIAEGAKICKRYVNFICLTSL